MRIIWKLLGLAGVTGVAATGAVIAREERKRQHYTADEIRTRLHQRYDEALARPASADGELERDPQHDHADHHVEDLPGTS